MLFNIGHAAGRSQSIIVSQVDLSLVPNVTLLVSARWREPGKRPTIGHPNLLILKPGLLNWCNERTFWPLKAIEASEYHIKPS